MSQKILNDIVNIKLDDIVVNPYQPRLKFKEEAIDSLAKSIKEHGLIQPISVRKKNEKYELIVGERRLRAFKKLEKEYIPAVIVNMENEESAFVALIENLQREDLNFLEEAYAMKAIMEEYKFTQKELAEKLGFNQSTISNKIRLLNFSEIVKKKIIESDLTERHARSLLKLKTESEILHVINKIKELDLNVKATERLIERINKEEKKKKTYEKSFINYKIYVNTIKNAVKSIEDTGINVEYIEKVKDEFVEIKLKIPKIKK